MRTVDTFARNIENITYDYEPGVDRLVKKELEQLESNGYRMVEGGIHNKHTNEGGYTITKDKILDFIRSGDFTGYWGSRHGEGIYLGDYVRADAHFKLENNGFVKHLRVVQPLSTVQEKAPLWRRLLDYPEH